MDQALELLFSIFSKFMTWIFSAYIFPGVSLGMLLIVIWIFVVMLHFMIAIPRVHVGARKVRDNDDD